MVGEAIQVSGASDAHRGQGALGGQGCRAGRGRHHGRQGPPSGTGQGVFLTPVTLTTPWKSQKITSLEAASLKGRGEPGTIWGPSGLLLRGVRLPGMYWYSAHQHPTGLRARALSRVFADVTK